MYYTAQALVDVLNEEEGTVLTLRKVRYYAQIGMLSEPELVNGKKKYTVKHLEELRAICQLQKGGKPLEEIKTNIRGLDVGTLAKMSQNATYFSEKSILDKTIYEVNEDATLLLSPNLEETVQHELVQAIQTIFQKHKGEL